MHSDAPADPQIESFAASFCAMNFMYVSHAQALMLLRVFNLLFNSGVTRTLLYIGLATGGPAAMW